MNFKKVSLFIAIKYSEVMLNEFIYFIMNLSIIYYDLEALLNDQAPAS